MQVDRLWIAREPVQKWPIDLSQRLSNGVYDLFILGDLDSDAIGTAGSQLIAEQVLRGAGLVTLGGYHAYGAGGWNNTPLNDLLPIQMGAAIRQPRNAPIDLRNHYEGAVPMVPAAVDRLLQIGEPGSNLTEVWGELKPLTGANRWGGVKNAPGVKVLAIGGAGQPLMVTGIAAQGRVMSLAFDSTFQWLRQGKVKEFKQFWRQVALWGLRREAVEEGMQLTMNRRRVLLQQPAEVMMNWSAGSKETPMPKEVSLRLWRLNDPLAEGQVAARALRRRRDPTGDTGHLRAAQRHRPSESEHAPTRCRRGTGRGCQLAPGRALLAELIRGTPAGFRTRLARRAARRMQLRTFGASFPPPNYSEEIRNGHFA